MNIGTVKKDSPLVSICIPVYNVENYINNCVKSVLEQTYKNIEIIFVNDQSVDNSVNIIRNILSKYPDNIVNAKIINHNINRGLAAARNTAIENASGEFIFHVDSDDWLEPKAVETLISIQRETEADIVSGNAIMHFADHIEILSEPSYPDREVMIHKVIEMTLDHVIWRRLIRRSLYTNNNIKTIEGLNIGEDHYTLPRLVFYAQKIAKTDKIVYHYNRLNENSYTNRDSMEKEIISLNSDLKSTDVLIDFFKEKKPELIDRLNIIKLKRLMFSLHEGIKYHNREFYKDRINEIKDFSPYWNHTKLKYSFYRIIVFNYTLNKLRYYLQNNLKKILKPSNYHTSSTR